MADTRKLAAGKDPGMSLRLLALFNPFCNITASLSARDGALSGSTEVDKETKKKRRASTPRIRSGGVLFADTDELAVSATAAPFLRYGLYTSTEIAIAVTAGMYLALSLPASLESTVESILIGLLGYISQMLKYILACSVYTRGLIATAAASVHTEHLPTAGIARCRQRQLLSPL